ncbi:helical backbone metal receptor [Fibrobacterales bacterium]|nr:helical backbone metal receptor [Fibrobacterales bacterium]
MNQKQFNRTVSFSLIGVLAVLALIGFINRGLNQNFIEDEIAKIHINEGYVSLAPSITEILFSLELDSQIVGVTKYCTFPKAAQSKQQVGGYLDPNLEAILALRPKLVFLTEEAEKLAKTLKKFDIQTIGVSHRSVEGILSSIQTIGDSTDRSQQAKAIVSDIRNRISIVKSIAEGYKQSNPSEKILVVIGKTVENGKIKSVTIAGNEKFYGSLIKIAGGQTAYQGPIPFPVLSREGLLVLNPDRIIDISTDLHKESKADSIARNVWSEMIHLNAVKNQRISVLPDRYNIIPGPRFILTLEGFSKAIIVN